MGRPKPYAQRRVRACHDGSNRQSGVTAALAAAQDAGSISEAERLSRHLTMGANEPAAPASLLQVGGAGRVVGKKSLKLWERLWEPKIATLVNVHEHGRTLALVAMGYNRIGKDHRSPDREPHRTTASHSGHRSVRAFLLVKRQGALDNLRKSRPHEAHARKRP